ncbi:recombinase family protein [Pseudonocardia petroleophila]|uniref:Recombinase family protein n=1 Tax=Pseudonocardia petroleophila TaxID=37331 RepID=A0A7G7MFS5_9PSEU|nr:recombinase family protein [Pseudonocardia petroleophila]QNG51636.1 recombinase family protein [Pseudonocardia petroleophila]
MTRVAIYLRISDDRRGLEEGVDRQREDCLRRASIEGWDTAHVYSDNDVGASTHSKKPRPGYASMLAAARRGEFSVILAYSNSRLTRRTRELDDLIDLYKDTGVRICTIVSGDDDLDTADGRMVAHIKASVDAAEAERTAERVTRAARQRAERGGNHGGYRPFGWNLDGTPREPEFSALRDGILAVTRGASIRSVAKAWDAAGLPPTGTAKLWTPSITSTRNALTRWRNAGIRVHRGQPLFDAPQLCEPAVTRDELEELLHHLDDRRRRTNGGRVAQSALLGSLADCGHCGAPLRASTHEISQFNPNRVGTYRCSPRGCVTIRRASLDEAVIEVVLAELLSADLTVLADSAEDRARLVWLRAQLAELAAREAGMAADYGAGEMSRAAWKAADAALQVKKTEAELSLREISDRFAPAEFASRERELLELSDVERDREAKDVLERFDDLELHRRREIIRGLVTITVNPGRVDDRIVIFARASKTHITLGWNPEVRFVDAAP